MSGVVSQADRDAAAACARYFGHDFTAVEVETGEADICSLVAIVSAHRIACQAELVEALAGMVRQHAAALQNWQQALSDAQSSGDRELAVQIQNGALCVLNGFPVGKARAALPQHSNTQQKEQ